MRESKGAPRLTSHRDGCVLAGARSTCPAMTAVLLVSSVWACYNVSAWARGWMESVRRSPENGMS